MGRRKSDIGRSTREARRSRLARKNKYNSKCESLLNNFARMRRKEFTSSTDLQKVLAIMDNPTPLETMPMVFKTETEEIIEENDINIKAEKDQILEIEIEEMQTLETETSDTLENLGNLEVTVKEENNLITEDNNLTPVNNLAPEEVFAEENPHLTITSVKNENPEIDMVHTQDNNDDNEVSIKEEIREPVVSYVYPNFDDADPESMDSIDATALGNVEACLQDEIDIKCENEGNYEDQQKDDFSNTDNNTTIKMESEVTLPETHITSNHITPDAVTDIRKYSFTTIPDDVVTDMDQIPNSSVNGNLYATNTNSYDTDNDNYENCDDLDTKMDPESFLTENGSCLVASEDFQLNSITGNMASLEQQVYESMKKYKCPKCTNTYRKKTGLQKHLGIHKTIDNYRNGWIKGVKTKQKNKKAETAKVKKKCCGKKDDSVYHPAKCGSICDNAIEQRTFGDNNDNSKYQTKREGYECTCGNVFRRRSRMETCLRTHEFFENNSKCFTCVTCTKQFKTKEELALHRKRLHRKKFPCKFCPTDYETRKELFKHLQIHQKVQLLEYKVIEEIVQGKQTLQCFMCSKTCAELSELKIHVMTDHKGPYICPHCKNTFPKIIDFGNHMKAYHPEVEGQSVVDVLEAFSRLVKEWKCEECNIQFFEADKLALHQIEQHSPERSEAQFQCTDCRRVFITQKGLTSHRRIHHSIEGTEEVKPEALGIMCLECRKICKDMTALTSHMRFHSPDRKYPCKFCDFRFATPEKRKAHAEIHTGDMKFVCFICEYQCSSENRLKQHKMSLKHANIKEYLLTGKPLVEESTSSKVKKRENTKKRKKDEDDESRSDSEGDTSKNKDITCDVCGEKFSSEKKMLEHKQTHPFIEFPNDDKPTRIFFK